MFLQLATSQFANGKALQLELKNGTHQEPSLTVLGYLKTAGRARLLKEWRCSEKIMDYYEYKMHQINHHLSWKVNHY